MQEKITVNWEGRREGNLGYVTEIRSDGTRSDFGPMPAHVVPAFTRGRQIIVAAILHKRGFSTEVTNPELEASFREMFSDSPLYKD